MAKVDPRLTHRALMESTLRKMPCFADWPSVALSRLLASCRLCWHERGEVLPTKSRTDEPEILLIVSGHVMHVECTIESARMSWGLGGPLHMLGFFYMLDLCGRVFEYVANDEVVAIHIPGRLLFELLDEDPVRWKGMCRMLLEQDRTQNDMVVGQIVGSLARRLACTIEQLAVLYGTRGTEKDTTHLRLTQQSLADILQVSRQSVSRQLSAWDALGVIKIKYNEISILDPAGLRNILETSCAVGKANSRRGGSRQPIADPACVEAILRATSAFSSWPATAMSKLLSHSCTGRHPPGHVFSSELRGPPEILLIVSGEAMVARVSPQGERFVVMLLGPGSILGMNQVFGRADRAANEFTAHSEVVAIHMPTLLLFELLDAEPILWKAMMQTVVEQNAGHGETLRNQIEGGLRRRIAATIERLAALHGTRIARGREVRLQLSQSDLATMLGANRQTINKELKALSDAGAVCLEYNALTVLNPEALRRMAKAKPIPAVRLSEPASACDEQTPPKAGSRAARPLAADLSN
ncbi:CRP-like cAMP-binding protein [Variovorax boronicumulans]|uniref:Crp/Fnr family transcriptional regulator n=1 Tax=Variovorax boronicumulans TaxID=436515 RepID=UPI0024744BBF|nr:Crp/Fnr family transcriptional regulator [Variovorax boronicumulans]MDH6166486.1 CRP-like cAMP-binding protein [Variovorax boronicumulans]